MHLHDLLTPLSSSSPDKDVTSPQTDFSLALAQLQKFCSPNSHPQRGETRSPSSVGILYDGAS